MIRFEFYYNFYNCSLLTLCFKKYETQKQDTYPIYQKHRKNNNVFKTCSQKIKWYLIIKYIISAGFGEFTVTVQGQSKLC